MALGNNTGGDALTVDTTFTIDLTDVNDNVPTCTMSLYSVNIDEDFAVSTQVTGLQVN